MKESTLNSVFDYTVYVCLIVLPLIVLPQLNLSFELPKILFFRITTMFLMLLFTLKIIKQKQIEVPDIFRNSNVRRLLGFFLLAIILCTIFSSAPQISIWGSYHYLQGLYTFLHYFLFFVLLVLNFKKAVQWEKVMKAIVVFLGVAIFLALMQNLSQTGFGFDLQQSSLGRVFAAFGQPNYFASYIALVFFPGLYFLKRMKYKSGFLMMLFFLFIALMMTGSRAAILAVFLGAVFYMTVSGFFLKKKKFIFVGILLPFLAGLFLLGVNLAGQTSFVKNTFLERLTVSEENLRSLGSRETTWAAAIEMSKDSLLFGYGLDTFPLIYTRYADEKMFKYEDFETLPERAHNNILDVTTQGGLLGILVYIFAWIVILKLSFSKLKIVDDEAPCAYARGASCERTARARSEAKNLALPVLSRASLSNKDTKEKIIGILAGLISLFIADLFGFPVTAHFVVATFLLGYLSFLLSDNFIEKKIVFKSNFLKYFVIIFVSIFSFFSIFMENVLIGFADHYALKGFMSIEENDLNGVIKNFEIANNLNPNQNYYKYLLASSYNQAGEKEKALEVLEEAGKFSSYQDFYFYLLKGKILNDPTGEDFEKAYSLYPVYPTLFLEWGKSYMESGDCEKAMQKFEKYLELVPDDWQETGEKRRLFYKNHPDFDRVFEYMEKCGV